MMNPYFKRISRTIILLPVIWLFSFSSIAQEDAQDNDEIKSYSVEQIEEILTKKFAEGAYSKSGADQCLRCHDETSSKNAMGIFKNIHGSREQKGSPFQTLQCEACHGPAGDHTKSRLKEGEIREPMIAFGSKSPLAADLQNSVCLGCHKDEPGHQWTMSEHQRAAVPCAGCHSVHQAHDPVQSKQTQLETCSTCHQAQAALTHQHSSHPLQNGQMQCTDCHSPHGSMNDASLKKATVNENCYSCHAEKRGPMLWEHEPVTEDCSTCHNPHGSVNPSLLTKRAPQLCQSCHTAAGHPSVPYLDQSVNAASAQFVLGNSCTNCHSQVHGSNHPSGKAFQR